MVDDYKYWHIFVYLITDKTIRRTQLQELLYRSTMWGLLWVMAGDFNDFIDNSEKLGGRIREISSFQDFLWDIGAIDLGFTGKP